MNCENNFYKIMKSANKIVCLQCKKHVSGINSYNIKRHYKLIHKKDITQNPNNEDALTKKRKIEENVKINIESSNKREPTKEREIEENVNDDEGETTKKRKIKQNVKTNIGKSKFSKSLNCKNNFYRVLKSDNKIVCLECEKHVSGINSFNIKRHYKLIHKKDITQNPNESNNEDSPPKKHEPTKQREIEEYVIIRTKSDDEGATTEKRKIKENVKINIDKSQFLNSVDCENNFYRVLKIANKIVCLECDKQISGTNSFNIKRHYKLVHKKDITQNPNESDDEGAPTKKQKVEEDVNYNIESDDEGGSTKIWKIEENVEFNNESDDEGAPTKIQKIEEDVKINIESDDGEPTKIWKIGEDVEFNNKSDDEGAPTKIQKIEEDLKINIESDDDGGPTKTLKIGEDVELYIEGNDEEHSLTKIRKIEEDVKINIQKSNFLKSCVGLVVVKNLPFRIFDDSDFFKNLISPYENKFETNINSKNIFDVIKVCCAKVQQIITKCVKNKMLCMKFDIGSRKDESILGINIQYIKDFKIHTNTIGMMQLNGRHKAVHLKEEILSCLKMYQIDIAQIYSSTTDNGANMLNVSQILQELREKQIRESSGAEDNDEAIHKALAMTLCVERCAAHTIQLAAHDVLNELTQQVSECRDAVEQLQKIFKSEDIQVQMPTLDNETRWNSTYEMLLSLSHARDYIDPLNVKMESIPNINWEFVDHFVAAFKPLVLYTEQLQKEQYVIGDFYRDWLCCEIELEELFSVTPISSLLYSSMQNRKNLLFNSNAFLAALYLDPRFNFENSHFLSKRQRCQAIEHLMKTFDILTTLRRKTEENLNEIHFVSCSAITRSELPTTSALAKLEQRATAEMTRIPSTERLRRSLKEKLKLLENNQKLPFDTNVLNYWKTSGDNDIKSIAEIALAVPASQVSMERTLSALSEVLNNLKSKPSLKALNDLVVTKLNFNMLKNENIFFDSTKNVNNKKSDK